MREGATEKLVVLGVAFVLFVGGLFVLSMERGSGRTILLACIFGALLCLAARQTLRRMKKRDNV
ncbi:MAG: hypothetical protein RR410_03755 [Alistipes sp.]